LKTYVIFFGLLLFSILLQAQVPKAAFTSTQTEGCAPLLVRFTQQSTNNPTSYFWDLGNGSTSTIADPTITYTTAGTYTIKLIARNNAGVDTVIKINHIVVNPVPIVQFNTIDTMGCFPLLSRFTDLTTISSGIISSWNWDFGDGFLSTQQNATHLYRLDNIFNVTLRVISQKGCVGVLTRKALINVGLGVTADFTNSFAIACKPPTIIDFTNNSTGPGTVKYIWKFGDGNQSNNTNVNHSFAQAGTYPVTLVATSDVGCTDSMNKEIVIPDIKITTNINAPDTGCLYQEVKLSGISTPGADNSDWAFGDGTFGTGKNVVKTYTTPGIYQIKLSNTVGICLDSAIKKIIILDGPTVDFSSTDTISCKAPFTVQFQDKSKGAVSWSWDFGDGTSSTDQNPVKTYTKEGIYTVSHMAFNVNGCGSYIKKDNFIKIAGPRLQSITLPSAGCAPLKIDFNAVISSLDSIVSYRWDFGNKDTSNLLNPTRTYNSTGIYPASFVATSKLGCTVTYTAPDAISVGVPPKADFDMSPIVNCVSDTVQFNDLSVGNINSWYWDFGETGMPGNIAFIKNPKYVYTDTGTFTVTLTAYNNGCPNTITKTNIIKVNGTIPNFEFLTSCTDKKTVAFRNTSINAANVSWDFGDNSMISTAQNPIHDFPDYGIYTVTLTSFQGGCSLKKTITITLIDQKAQFDIPETIFCKKSIIHFNSTSTTTDTKINTFEWDWGSGGFQQGTNQFAFTYNTLGAYKVQLKITDRNGCSDTASTTIVVGGPEVKFVALNPTGCVGLQVNFEDLSTSDGVNAITNRRWNFGDLGTASIKDSTIQHQYNIDGFFDVTLILTDAVGCTDSLTQSALVIASNPKANFTVIDSVSCPGKPIQFISNSTGVITNYDWTFGDGKTSVIKNPLTFYGQASNYTVGLMITDKYGCKDSVIKASFIVIDTPVAKISLVDSIGSCPPFTVKFNSNSSFVQKLRWSFGDGDISLLDSPSHIYSTPGDYTARLLVTSPGGCTNFSTKSIKVFGPNGVIRFTPTTGCIPTLVKFTVTSNNTDSLIWDFRDGNSIISKDLFISHLYTQATDKQPMITLQDAQGCRFTIPNIDTLKIVGFQPDFGVVDALLCDKGTTEFFDKTSTNGSLQKWNWDFGDGNVGTGPAPSHFYKDTGVYTVKLKVTSQNNCIDSISIPRFIKVVPSPEIGINALDSVCQNGFMTFKGLIIKTDTATLQWFWNFGNGETAILQNPIATQYRTVGTLTSRLIALNSNGCSDTALKTIIISALPKTDAGVDSIICRGVTTQLQATGAFKYEWQLPNNTLSCTNCAIPFAKPDSTIMYRVKGISAEGCEKFDSVRIQVIQQSVVKASLPDSICVGQSVRLTASGSQLYQWIPANVLNNPTSSAPIARIATTTMFTVIGSDAVGCFPTKDSVKITVFPIPLVNAGADITLPAGIPFRLNANPSADVNSIVWTPATYLSCTNCPAPFVSPKTKTEYTITVTNAGGCVNEDKITISVNCGTENIFIPNIFSPNGDGINDVFYIRGSGITGINYFRIFNRWGQLVFERKNAPLNTPSAGWNGTLNGVLLPPDAYVYMVDVNCDNGKTTTLKGDITLVR
jgi:gliding motility-associated-like protein